MWIARARLAGMPQQFVWEYLRQWSYGHKKDRALMEDQIRFREKNGYDDPRTRFSAAYWVEDGFKHPTY